MADRDDTIRDFGTQWTRYPDFTGHLRSRDLLADTIGPFLQPADLEGCRVAEIGSGQGRFATMLLDAGVAHVVAIEPSAAFAVLQRHLQPFGARAQCVQASGEAIAAFGDLDDVFSIGVLHHIADPKPVVRAALGALRPGGRMVIWLYGREGNGLYLALVLPLRRVTRRLPAPVLAGLSHALAAPLSIYAGLCGLLPLPLHTYMRNVVARLTWRQRMLTVYDQLNPSIAKYYSRAEAAALLADAGFADVQLHHRYGYSWTVTGVRPVH